MMGNDPISPKALIHPRPVPVLLVFHRSELIRCSRFGGESSPPEVTLD